MLYQIPQRTAAALLSRPSSHFPPTLLSTLLDSTTQTVTPTLSPSFSSSPPQMA